MNEPTQLLQAEKDELQEAGMEIRHLKSTIAALREELEGMQYEMQESVQRAVADAADEATQLMETATALRQELDTSISRKTRPSRRRRPIPTTKSSS